LKFAAIPAALIAAIVYTSPASADAGLPPGFIPDPPTLAETTAWLSDNLPLSFSGTDRVEYLSKGASYSFAGCIMTMNWRITSRISRPDEEPTITTDNPVYVVQMEPRSGQYFHTRSIPGVDRSTGAEHFDNYTGVSDMDLAKVRLDSITVKRITVPAVASGSVGGLLNINVTLATFAAKDESHANRLAKALRYAATKCHAYNDIF
jgi:hypothetical protein